MNQGEIEFFENEGIICQDVIASGSYGIIFYVYHKLYRDFFALKKIPEKNFHEGEIKCLMGIDDPRIVRLYKYYKYNDSLYLLMEYCPSDLDKYLKTHRISSYDELRKLIYDVILAVKVCHDKNVAHCDIKPSNFMVDHYGRIKIGDFGLSMIGAQTCMNCKGTPLFMAPEIFMKKTFDPIKADVWSLGVLIFYLCTNFYPFYGKDKTSLSQHVINGLYDDSEISDLYLKNMIKHCLEKNPDRRVRTSDLLCFPYFKDMNTFIPKIAKNDSLSKIVKPQIQKRRSSNGDLFMKAPKIKVHRCSNDSILV